MKKIITLLVLLLTIFSCIPNDYYGDEYQVCGMVTSIDENKLTVTVKDMGVYKVNKSEFDYVYKHFNGKTLITCFRPIN